MADSTSSFFAGIPRAVIAELLKDRSTGRNILWSADGGEEMTLDDVKTIQPRVYKRLEEQKARTKKRAEVFTPVKIVKKMNDYLHEEAGEELVTANCLEITCGEAPFITSRYDTTTGEKIEFSDRVGLLDLKLQWYRAHKKTAMPWARRAVESVFGFEFQGDNLLIARVNVWRTIVEYLGFKPKWLPDVVCWNFWQMNGLTMKVNGITPCVMDWNSNVPVLFTSIRSSECTSLDVESTKP